jgi:transposase-like protein
MFQGCSWRRCRVHFLHNLLSHIAKAGKAIVATAMKSVFVIQAPYQVRAHWQRNFSLTSAETHFAALDEPAADNITSFLKAVPAVVTAKGCIEDNIKSSIRFCL